MTSDRASVPVGRFPPPIEGWEITPTQVKALIDSGEEVVWLDCRTPAEHELVRLPNSVFAPIQDAVAQLPNLQPLAGRRIVVYCHHGIRSLQMTAFLRQQGFDNVKSLAGGIDRWALEIEPDMQRY